MTEILTNSQKDKQAEILFTYLQEEIESTAIEAVFNKLFNKLTEVK